MPLNPQEEWMALLRRAQQQVTPEPSTLPDLDPSMLLSAAGRREMQAAQQLIPQIGLPLMSEMIHAGRAELSTGRLLPSQTWDPLTLAYPDAHLRPQQIALVASMEAPVRLNQAERVPTLEELFMERARIETGDSVEPMAFTGSNIRDFIISEESLVEFDSTDIEGTTAPNERVRFQVGRESPPYQPFRSDQSSHDGQVVARRTERGFEAEPRPQQQRPVRAPVTAKAAEPEPYVKSRYERLLEPSPLD